MKFCTTCGNPLDETASVCAKCGTPVSNAPAATPQAQPQFQQPQAQPQFQQPQAQPQFQQPQYQQPQYQQPQYQQPQYRQPQYRPQYQKPKTVVPDKAFATAVSALNFFYAIIAILMALFAFLALAEMYISGSVYYSSYSSGIKVSISSHPEDDYLIVAFIAAIVSTLIAIGSLAISAAKRLGINRILNATAKMIASITFGIVFLTYFA